MLGSDVSGVTFEHFRIVFDSVLGGWSGNFRSGLLPVKRATVEENFQRPNFSAASPLSFLLRFVLGFFYWRV